MTTTYMGTGGVAQYLGLTTGSVKSYVAKGLLPEPDVMIEAPSYLVRGWRKETIDEWMKNRPGNGARTDLKKKERKNETR